MGDGLDAGNAKDFVAIGERQRLNDGNAVDDHETVGTGDIGAAIESAAHDGEEREEKERDGEGADGQDEAKLFAEEVGEN